MVESDLPGAGLRNKILMLPGNVRGALWVVLACILFSAMMTLTKFLGDVYDSFQMAFFRALFGLFAILPFVVRLGPAVIRTRRLGLHIVRSILGAAAMFCGFYAITHLPLADAVSISYARPLFLIPLAVLMLGEVVRLRRWSATAIGFIGVIVMLRPGGELEWATLVALLGAALVACVTILIKKLTLTERPETLLFYFGVVSTLTALAPALIVWRPVGWIELVLFMAIGAFGASGQYCMIRGYKIGEATALIPFDYTRLLFAGIIGYFLFFEIPDLWTLTGAGIIVGSTLYIALREAQLGTRDKDARPTTKPKGPPRTQNLTD
jgi:drug/metabolite transporter (DMT)-like permease